MYSVIRLQPIGDHRSCLIDETETATEAIAHAKALNSRLDGNVYRAVESRYGTWRSLTGDSLYPESDHKRGSDRVKS